MKWFKHESNTRLEVLVRRLIKKYGIEGYGLYIAILEAIAERITDKDPIPDCHEMAEDLSDYFGLDIRRVEEITLYCLNIGLFHQSESTGRIVSIKMVDYLDDFTRKSERVKKLIKSMSKEFRTHGIFLPNNDLKVRQSPTKSDKVRLEKKKNRKEVEEETEIERILDHWNKQEIYHHKKITTTNKIQKRHLSIINDYGIDTIFTAILNYKKVVAGEAYYFTHKWTLWDFLSRGLDKFVDDADPLNNFLKSKPATKQPAGFQLPIKICDHCGYENQGTMNYCLKCYKYYDEEENVAEDCAGDNKQEETCNHTQD